MCRRQLSASQTSLLQAARRLGTAGGPPLQMTGGPLRSSSSRRCQPCLSRPPSPMTHGAPQPAASCSSSSRTPAHRYYHDSTYIKTCRTYVISNLKYLSMFKGSCVSDAGGVFCHVFSGACLVSAMTWTCQNKVQPWRKSDLSDLACGKQASWAPTVQQLQGSNTAGSSQQGTQWTPTPQIQQQQAAGEILNSI